MLDNLTARLAGVMKTLRGEARITESNIADALREVRMALLEADVALPVVKDFIARIRAEAVGEKVAGSLTPGQALVGVVNAELAALMGGGTAGGLGIDEAMMREIAALHAAVNPAETLFVVDAMQGQDAINTAKAFRDALPLTGVVLTKLDGDSRGGAALSVKAITGVPIKFAGVGEKLNGLE